MLVATQERVKSILSYADQHHAADLTKNAKQIVEQYINKPSYQSVGCVDSKLNGKLRVDVRFAGGVGYLTLENKLEEWIANRENGGGGELSGHTACLLLFAKGVITRSDQLELLKLSKVWVDDLNRRYNTDFFVPTHLHIPGPRHVLTAGSAAPYL